MGEREDSQYRSEIRLRLEAENRSLQNKYLDLEFAAAEVEVQNELLANPKKSLKQDSLDAKVKEINNLKRQLLQIQRQSRDSKLMNEQYQRILKNKQNDIEFLKSEIAEIKLHMPTETMDQLKTLLDQRKVEIQENQSMLDVLQKEESDNQLRLDELRRNLNITGEIKPLPSDWKEEPIFMGELIHSRADYKESRAAYDEVKSILDELKRDQTFGTQDADGLAASLYAEMNLTNNSDERSLSTLMEQEYTLSESLQKELEEVRKATAKIKQYREICYDRQKKHYDIAVSQQWLNVLQNV